MTTNPPEPAALVPVRQQTVDFYGDQLPAGQLADGTILVPLRPIVEALGLNWSGQFLRVRRDPVLAEVLTVCVMQTVQGERELLAVPLKYLPGFLFGVSSSRVKPELRTKIQRYQADCYEVLWTAFKGDILPAAPPSAFPPPSDLTGAARALEIAEALYHLARQQMALEQAVYDLNAHAVRTDDRLAALELHLSAGATISEAQAAEIAGAVKNVAHALEERGIANPYQQVWGELYKRYRVAAYRNLPAARYAEALGWLQGWYTELGSVAEC
jgi:hypothetical protein